MRGERMVVESDDRCDARRSHQGTSDRNDDATGRKGCSPARAAAGASREGGADREGREGDAGTAPRPHRAPRRGSIEPGRHCAMRLACLRVAASAAKNDGSSTPCLMAWDAAARIQRGRGIDPRQAPPWRDDEFAGASIRRVLSILKPFRRTCAAASPGAVGAVAHRSRPGRRADDEWPHRAHELRGRRSACARQGGKRVTAQPIGRAAERDFDWKSVQSPERWRDEAEGRDGKFNGNGFSASFDLRETESKRPRSSARRAFGREAPRDRSSACEALRDPRISWRRSSPSRAR